MYDDLFGSITGDFNFEFNNVHLLSPLVLAYIGDAVYEVFIRTMLISANNAPVHKLHKLSVNYVKAKAQAEILHRIMDNLTQEEQEIVRRGRNAKSGTIPKNADVTEYKYATAYECLIGFLYLKKNFKRLTEIFKMSFADNKVQDEES